MIKVPVLIANICVDESMCMITPQDWTNQFTVDNEVQKRVRLICNCNMGPPFLLIQSECG